MQKAWADGKILEINHMSEVLTTLFPAGQDLTVHGWIYNIADGLLSELDVQVSKEAISPDSCQYHCPVCRNPKL